MFESDHMVKFIVLVYNISISCAISGSLAVAWFCGTVLQILVETASSEWCKDSYSTSDFELCVPDTVTNFGKSVGRDPSITEVMLCCCSF